MEGEEVGVKSDNKRALSFFKLQGDTLYGGGVDLGWFDMYVCY